MQLEKKKNYCISIRMDFKDHYFHLLQIINLGNSR